MASQVALELLVTDDIAGGRLAMCMFPWAETEFFFSDERCVPPDHDASNYRMAREALLSKVPATVHRMPGETCDAGA